MPLKHPAAVAALAMALVASASTGAFAITCFDLPEEARAAGTLQGLSTCGMSVAEARRVLAGQSGYEQVAPAPRAHRRHRQAEEAQPY